MSVNDTAVATDPVPQKTAPRKRTAYRWIRPSPGCDECQRIMEWRAQNPDIRIYRRDVIRSHASRLPKHNGLHVTVKIPTMRELEDR